MKVNIGSSDTMVLVDVAADKLGILHLTTDATSGLRATRHVSVLVQSGADSVNVSLKPSVIAQEERQERLNHTIRQGFAPISQSTRG